MLMVEGQEFNKPASHLAGSLHHNGFLASQMACTAGLYAGCPKPCLHESLAHVSDWELASLQARKPCIYLQLVEARLGQMQLGALSVQL